MNGGGYDPIKVFAAAFGISSLGGLASLLRSNKPLTWRNVFAAVLYSGVIGLGIALAWHKQYSETNLFFLLAVSAFAGIGGATSLDLLLQALRRGGVSIVLPTTKTDDKDGESIHDSQAKP